MERQVAGGIMAAMETLPGIGPGIGVGTWAWGNRLVWDYDPGRDDGLLPATVQAAIRAGVRLFDTADSYGTGALRGCSERLLGAAVDLCPPPLPPDLVIATKLAPYPWRLGRRAFDRPLAASRCRLRGRLDRVQLHWSTARYAPWQEDALLDGLADLVQTGVVRELGVSNMGPRRLRRWHGRLRQRGVLLCSVQVQLSPLCRDALAPEGVLSVCRELAIDALGYSPLALGLLSGRWSLQDRLPTGLRGLLFRRLLPGLEPLQDLLAEVARGHGSTPTAVCLNWCRAHGAQPLVGLRRPEQVPAIADALSWRLTEAERGAIDAVAGKLTQRMPANPFTSS
jgi:pyridoxine 4-dehydrogenase